jgi:hypothetical protein
MGNKALATARQLLKNSVKAKFAEIVIGEVLRISLPRTPVNRVGASACPSGEDQ